MDNKLQDFISKQNFDFNEPHAGHLDRFEKKLNNLKHKQTSWKWLSIAASVILVIGFSIGNSYQNRKLDLADVSPKMEEVQNYFITTINQDIKTLEKNRNLETEAIIENALEELEELEDSYKVFIKELTNNGNHRKLINAMIKNYQKRLEILERTINKIEQIKNPNTLEDEIFI